MLRKILNRILQLYIILRDRYVERQLGKLSEQERFSLIYRTGYWKGAGKGSRSGEGSSMNATDTIRKSLPLMLKSLGIRSMLDVPCGDWHWMSTLELGGIQYTGADIVDELVQQNQLRYGSPDRRFVKLDLTRRRSARMRLGLRARLPSSSRGRADPRCGKKHHRFRFTLSRSHHLQQHYTKQ